MNSLETANPYRNASTSELSTAHGELDRQARDERNNGLYDQSPVYAEVKRRAAIRVARDKKRRLGNAHHIGLNRGADQAPFVDSETLKNRSNTVINLARRALYMSNYNKPYNEPQDVIETTVGSKPGALYSEDNAIVLGSDTSRAELHGNRLLLRTKGETVDTIRVTSLAFDAVGVHKVDPETDEIVSSQVFHNPVMAARFGDMVIQKVGGVVEAEITAANSNIQDQLMTLR